MRLNTLSASFLISRIGCSFGILASISTTANKLPLRSRLRFRRKRGAMRHWSLGNGSGRYQRCDSRSRGFTGAGIQRLFPAKSHCKYLALNAFYSHSPNSETFSPVANRRIDRRRAHIPSTTYGKMTPSCSCRGTYSVSSTWEFPDRADQ